MSALAIACVYHLNTIQLYYPSGLPLHDIWLFDWIYHHGSIFVELFLVISGFMTFTVYTDRIDRDMGFRRYAAKRAIRIYPLMIATLIVSVVGTMIWFLTHDKTFWWGSGSARDTLTSLVFSFLGLQYFFPGLQCWNYPSWSLSVFFTCWVLYYILVAVTRKEPENRRYRRMIGCIVVILIGVSIHYNGINIKYMLLNSAVARGYIAFFSGGLLYYLNRSQKPENIQKNVALAVTFLCLLAVMRALGIEVGNYTILFGGVIFPLIIFVVLNVKSIHRIMSIRPLTFLGKISFSIYLCNYPIEIFLELLNEKLGWAINCSTTAFLLCYIAVHILIGTLFCVAFEQYIPNRLKKKYGV